MVANCSNSTAYFIESVKYYLRMIWVHLKMRGDIGASVGKFYLILAENIPDINCPLPIEIFKVVNASHLRMRQAKRS